jgi:hypothetical protein
MFPGIPPGTGAGAFVAVFAAAFEFPPALPAADPLPAGSLEQPPIVTTASSSAANREPPERRTFRASINVTS